MYLTIYGIGVSTRKHPALFILKDLPTDYDYKSIFKVQLIILSEDTLYSISCHGFPRYTVYYWLLLSCGSLLSTWVPSLSVSHHPVLIPFFPQMKYLISTHHIMSYFNRTQSATWALESRLCVLCTATV